MRYEHFHLGQLETNGFVLYDGKNAVIIDPGGDVDNMQAFLRGMNLKPVMILNTHLHFDHTFGNALLSEGGKVPIHAGKADSFMLQSKSGRGGKWGIPVMEPYEFEDLKPGELKMLDTTCRVLATPGHSPGGLSFYFPEEGVVFAGDSLFAGAIGRTDFEGGDLQTLLGSIFTQLYTLPENTVVWPGHGPATTVGEEKRYNPYNGMYRGSPQ